MRAAAEALRPTIQQSNRAAGPRPSQTAEAKPAKPATDDHETPCIRHAVTISYIL